MSCVTCNTPPAPCDCKPDQTCVQTSRNCSTCPVNICIQSSQASAPDPSAHSSNIGGVVGGTLGGVLGALALFGLGWFLFRRGFLNRFFSSSSSPKSFKPRAFHYSKDQPERRSKALSKAYEGSPQTPSSPGPTPPPADATHQKHGSSSSRRISEAILNKRNSAHMMDVIDPDTHDLQSHRSANLLALNPSRNPQLLIEDDPFSDRNSRKSLTRQLPPIGTNSPLLGSDPALHGLTHHSSDFSSPNSLPVAYIPPTSKSLSIEDVDDRDGLGNSGPSSITTSGCLGPDPALRSQTSNLISFDPSDHRQRSPHPSPTLASAFRSSFLPHNTGGLTSPSPSGAPGASSKPIRPPRAPGLDLRLPTATAAHSDNASLSPRDGEPTPRPRKSTFGRDQAEAPSACADSRFSVDSSLPRHSVASLAPSSIGRWSQPPPMPAPYSPSLPRHRYGSNDGMPPGSRLSLDSSHAHYSFLSGQPRPMSNVSDATTHDSHLSSILDPAMIVTPVTLVRTASGRQAAVQRVALRGQEKARVVRLNRNSGVSNATQAPPLPTWTSHATVQPNESPKEPLGTLARAPSGQSLYARTSTLPHKIDEDEIPKSDSLSTVVVIPSDTAPGDNTSQSSSETTPRDPFTDSAAVEVIRSPNQHASLKLEPRRRASGQGTSEGTPSLCSHVTTTDTHRQANHPPIVYHHPAAAFTDESLSRFTPSVHSNATTALADHGHETRAPSVVAGIGSFVPPRSSLAASSVSGHESFMEAGAVPDDVSLASRSIYGHQQLGPSLNAMVAEEFERSLHLQPSSRPFATHDDPARASVISTAVSVRSGYGSMLEGIPFNIGFNSTGDDGFGGLGDLTGVEEGDEESDALDDMRAGLQFVEQTDGT